MRAKKTCKFGFWVITLVANTQTDSSKIKNLTFRLNLQKSDFAKIRNQYFKTRNSTAILIFWAGNLISKI